MLKESSDRDVCEQKESSNAAERAGREVDTEECEHRELQAVKRERKGVLRHRVRAECDKECSDAGACEQKESSYTGE